MIGLPRDRRAYLAKDRELARVRSKQGSKLIGMPYGACSGGLVEPAEVSQEWR